MLLWAAGIAGVATAYHLTRQGVTDVVLVDERPPLSLTSDKSTEGYRNWWPGPGDAMVPWGMVKRWKDTIPKQELIEALTANLISVNRRYKAHAGLRVTDV